MTRIPKASAAVAAATLVSAAALLGAGGALATEPLRLNAAQMDAITAGAVPFQASNAAAIAQGSSALTLADTSAKVSVKDDKHAQSSGVGSATAASDLLAATNADSLSLIFVNDNTYAGVYTTTSGVALGDDAYSSSLVKTWGKQVGVVLMAGGTALTYVDGTLVNATATTIPFAAGTITRIGPTTMESTTGPGWVVTSGSAMSINPPGLANGTPGKGRGVFKK